MTDRLNMRGLVGDLVSTRPTLKAWGGFVLVLLVVLSGCESQQQTSVQGRSYNILFVSVDDWNDWVGALSPWHQAQTPNMDRLAARGMLFTNAHTAAPLCNPSRSAILSGMRPSTTGIYDNAQPIRYALPDFVSLPQYFSAHGWTTHGGGKLYHDPQGFVDMASWDERFFWNPNAYNQGGWENYSRPPDPEPPNRPEFELPRLANQRNFVFAPVDVPDSDMPDYKVVSWADDFLQQEHDKPFFLAVGLFRPHVPWFVPPKYFDMYPLESIERPPLIENDLDDVPAVAKRYARKGGAQHQDVLQTNSWEKAIQGYLASISFSDAQLGRLLDALEASEYADNTIIVLWSDHGYHLGEKEHWHKRALWHRATHVPLIFAVPGLTKPESRSSRPVDLTALYPTLLELSGLPPKPDLDGHSIVPLLKDPEADWPYPALTTNYFNNHSVRTERWHYIRYEDGSEELYDHENDPHEWTNLAGHAEYGDLKRDLAQWLPETNAQPAPQKNVDIAYDVETWIWKKISDGDPTPQ